MKLEEFATCAIIVFMGTLLGSILITFGLLGWEIYRKKKEAKKQNTDKEDKFKPRRNYER